MKWSSALNGVRYEYEGKGIPSSWYSSKENGVYDTINIGDICCQDRIDMSGIVVTNGLNVDGINYTPQDYSVRDPSTIDQMGVIDLSKACISGDIKINAVIDELKVNNVKLGSSSLGIEGEFQKGVDLEGLEANFLDINWSLVRHLNGSNIKIKNYLSFEYLVARSVVLDDAELGEFNNFGDVDISYFSAQNLNSTGSLHFNGDRGTGAKIDFMDLRGTTAERLNISNTTIGAYLIDEKTKFNQVISYGACNISQKLAEEIMKYSQ